MMDKIDFIFIALVYRDYSDLEDLCASLKKNVDGTYKVVAVDAYFDENTSQKITERAKLLGCDYIRIENKGYGYGNNRGIEFANAHYKYEWIVICNPDTMLKSKISISSMAEFKGIVAPDVVAKTGKHQNPYWACENRFSEKLIYLGYNRNNKLLTYIGVGINKILRDMFRSLYGISKGKINTIYACHGSFLFVKNEFAQKYRYDEEMFLFYEEACLAIEAKRQGVPMKFVSAISVFHKEDGSMNMANIVEYPHLKKSYEHYYKRYRNAK